METVIYLIRHGETVWNRERRVQGHQNLDLSKEGMKQARRLGDYLRDWNIDAVYSSDLKRACRTAESVARPKGLEVQPLVQLRERNLGEWEGLKLAEVERRYPGDWKEIWNRGGKYGIEKAENTQRRMMDQIQRLAEKHLSQTIVVVSHGGSINAVLEAVSGGIYGPGKSRIRNTGISRLVYHSEKGWRVERVSITGHLDGSVATSIASHFSNQQG
ncbi:histidine phosphatase family protein [Paludifilum halophilum]|uniref:histidine phosphatase family protein n=1 Tax=Paludifilum halophilum TaxID=1642702 RepID=UPI00146F91BA|nr:histidine phosphatase family protein [Paludifilum halophilum]